MSRLRKVALALAMVVAVVLSVPLAARADVSDTDVAKIGDTGYETLDEAISKAKEGETIDLLADATTEGMNLSKNLTIKSAEDLAYRPTVTFTKNGIALWGKSLTFKNCKVVMNGIGSTPYSEWGWMTICASSGASMTLDNVEMTMDADKASGSPHAIYFCNDNVLNLNNGTVLTIKNYPNDALEWDGGNGGYNVNITNSSFISDHNRSGFTGTFWVTADNSLVKVINSLGNGSNGSHFKLTDCVGEGKGVFFNDNGSHGLSAGNLTIVNSNVEANDNGMYGVTYNGNMSMDGTSTLEINRNALNNSGGGLCAATAGKSSQVAAGARINIRSNGHNGLENYGTFTFDEAEDGNPATILNIVGNDERTTNGGGIFNGSAATLTLPSTAVITNNHAGKTGGGICNAGIATIPAGVQIYNNHADQAGDDIYNRDGATISFPQTGEWLLDNTVTKVNANNTGTAAVADSSHDVQDDIDGWYDDSEDARWEAHATSEGDNHAVEFTEFDQSNMATVENLRALKAAHGLKPLDPDDPDAPDWSRSKSKSATPLVKGEDGKWTSDVTLSLPSAQEELVSDVVFVLDKSTSQDIENAAIDMLKSLSKQVEESGAKVKVGVVVFNKEAHTELQLTELNDENMASIEKAIKFETSSGTNTHAGLMAGISMLNGDTSVDDSRKYLVFVSDGITYMYNEVPTAIALENGDKTNVFAGPDNWATKYGTSQGPDNWETWLSQIEGQIATDGEAYEGLYDGNYADKFISYDDRANHAMSIDKALYLTYQTYQQVVGKYHCYAMLADSSAAESHPWASSFMNFLIDGQQVSFEDIQNDIYYCLGANSKVVDIIGEGTDNLSCEYDFAFVNEASELVMTVGETTYNAEKISDNTYGFNRSDGQYDYVLTYYPNGYSEGKGIEKTSECFVWQFNVPVTNFQRASLTYTVELTNPAENVPGTHGVYDQFGTNKDEDTDSLLTNVQATLYPVDSEGKDGQPERFRKPTVSYSADTVTVWPADMTVYMGGSDGYDAVVDGSDGTVVDESTGSLPEPGFYIDLGDEINELLKAQDPSVTTATDLSDIIKFRAAGDNTREWKFERYGGDRGSEAYDRFVYRLVPTGDQQDPVRLEFTSGDEHFTSDSFNPKDEGALSNEYEMGIYAGDVNLNNILMDITIGDETYTRAVRVETGTLTIRYVVDAEDSEGNPSNPVTNVVNGIEDAATKGDDAYAVIDDGADYYVNESGIDTTDGASPSLLFDSIVSDETGASESSFDGLLSNGAENKIAGVDPYFDMQGHESKYLDLVDAANGNAWLTTDSPVTVYWPYPANTGKSTEFHLVHFQGLDRDMANGSIETEIRQTNPDYITVENTDYGVMFTLQPEEYRIDNDGTTVNRVRFSPFVLAWGTSSTPPVTDYDGDLKVSKTVTGNLANLNDEFTFRVTVEGAGDQTYGGVKFTDDVATITLKGGETVTIKNLPKGAKYTVEETNALDYELVSSKKTSGTIPDGSVTASFVNDKSEPETLDPTDPVNPGGSKVLLDADGNPVALSGGEFTFKLTGLDGAPMPAGAVDGSITVTNRADGVFVFGDIVFDEAGTYTYELTEVAGTDEGITYDGSTHTLVVVVSDEDADGDGKLDIASLTYDGESTLPTFTNETTSDEPPAPDPDQPGTDEPAEPTTPGVPDTGDHTVSALPAVLALGGVALVGGALAVARRRVR